MPTATSAHSRVYIVEVEKTVNRNIYVRAATEADIERIPEAQLMELWEEGDPNTEAVCATHVMFIGWEESSDMDYPVHLDLTKD